MPRRFADISDQAVLLRLLERCVSDPNSGCLLFEGFCDEKGYGTTWDPRARKVRRAHRLSWELHNGPIPEGVDVLHWCDTPPCVRPDHLFLGNAAINAADREAKGRGRQPKREDHNKAKLTEVRVALMRERFNVPGLTLEAIAAEFGVSFGNVWKIKVGRIWKIAQ